MPSQDPFRSLPPTRSCGFWLVSLNRLCLLVLISSFYAVLLANAATYALIGGSSYAAATIQSRTIIRNSSPPNERRRPPCVARSKVGLRSRRLGCRVPAAEKGSGLKLSGFGSCEELGGGNCAE